MKSETFHIETIDELTPVIQTLKKLCSSHSIFIVDGKMGAGKTTLISKVCLALGIKDKPSSPTYSIVNTYFSDTFGEINHFDFYRLKDENEALESGLDEPFYNDSICFIEWAKKIQNILPEELVKVEIEVLENNHRKITITL